MRLSNFRKLTSSSIHPVKRYSSGMYLRLAFAVAAHLEPEILVVDEVLAVGDAEFQRKCLGKMSDVAQQGRTVLFVSHNMSAILRLTQETIVIEKGRLGMRAPTPQAVDYYLSQGYSQEGQRIWEPDEVPPDAAPFCPRRHPPVQSAGQSGGYGPFGGSMLRSRWNMSCTRRSPGCASAYT